MPARDTPGKTDLATLYPGIAADWHPTLNGERTPAEFTKGSNTFAWWQCTIRKHAYWAQIKKRTAGRGCPVCTGKRVLTGFNDLTTHHPEIAREWHLTRNTLRPTEVTPVSSRRIWWQCAGGHEWEAAVRNRTAGGSGCPICSGRIFQSGHNDLATTHPHLTLEWAPERNTLRPTQVRATSTLSAWWRCNTGHEWTMTIETRVRYGSTCPTCRLSVLRTETISSQHPHLAREWHPTRNERPLDSYAPRSSQSAWWLCEKHGHSWRARIDHRTTAGTGCPVCSGHRVMAGFNDLTTTHPHLAEQWHPTKNTVTATTIGFGSTKKAWWLCPLGHEWIDTPNSRSNQQTGCVFCSGHRVLVGFNDLATLRPEIASQWHPNRNSLTPVEVTLGANKYAWWQCNEGHEWRTMVSKRTGGTGCPTCKLAQTSRREQAICSIIASHFGVEYEGPQKVPGCRSKVDLALPALTTAVEFDSWYWHRASAERDGRKTDALHAAGWTVVRIREAQGRHVLPHVDGILIGATVTESPKSIAAKTIAAVAELRKSTA